VILREIPDETKKEEVEVKACSLFRSCMSLLTSLNFQLVHYISVKTDLKLVVSVL
jgi:hypothetical protein